MHIVDWCRDRDATKLRGWALQRYLTRCRTPAAEHLAFLATSTDLALVFQVTWEVEFQGDEAAAWESLDRYASGRPCTYLVVARSYGLRGFLTVIADADEEAARRGAARAASLATGTAWLYAKLVLPDGQHALLVPEGYDDRDLALWYSTHQGCFYELFVAPLVYDSNIPGVVLW